MEVVLRPYLNRWQEHKQQVESNSAGMLVILWALAGVILRAVMLFFGAMTLRAGFNLANLDKDLLSLPVYLLSSCPVWGWGIATVATLLAIREIPQGKWPRVFFSVLRGAFLLVLLLLFVVFFGFSLSSGGGTRVSVQVTFWLLLTIFTWAVFLAIRLVRRRLGWFLTSISAFCLLCSSILITLSSLAIRIYGLSVWTVPLAGLGIAAGIFLYFGSLSVIFHYEVVKVEKEN